MPRSKPRRVLCVGSDPRWQEDVQKSLGLESALALSVAGGAEAIDLAEDDPPDLVILDMLLADMTGLGLCRIVREHAVLADVPVIVVSSHASEVDRILAFELGADDYLPAPFFPRELASRVRAVMRRSREESEGRESAPRSFGQLTLDRERKQAFTRGRALDLTSTEFEILQLLIGREGRVLSREQILRQLPGEAGRASERTVDAHVKSIRRKLGEARDLIETVRGAGYRFAGLDRGLEVRTGEEG